MATQGCTKTFNLESPELWDSYMKCLKFFLEANTITNAALKWTQSPFTVALPTLKLPEVLRQEMR